MKKFGIMTCLLILSIILFVLALLLFNDISFILLGIGVVFLGLCILIKVNTSKE